MTETLADRASRYFGIFKSPRRSVSLGRSTVAIFAGDRLYVYDEAAYPKMAITVRLTENRRDDLMAELERGLPLIAGDSRNRPSPMASRKGRSL